MAAGYVDKKEEVVTLLQLGQGAPSNQVLLRVRFAEVSRSAMTELGVDVRRQRLQGRPLLRPRRRRSSSPAPQWDEDGKFVFSDFLNLFLFDSKEQLAVVDQGAADEGPVPEPRRAEPGRRERQGSELPGRRRVPDSDRPGQRRQHRHQRHVQGVRRPPDLHADRDRRPRPPEGEAGSERARLQQRRRPRRLPDSRPDHPPDRDRARAAERPDVRDRRPDEQHDAADACRRFPGSATSRSSATCSAARRRRRTRPSWS